VTEKIAVSKSGFIKIDGEIWLATSNTFGFEVGEKVKIEITNGNVAVVVKHLE
jgi:membrane protein implicated in regulation of membrane protease activity